MQLPCMGSMQRSVDVALIGRVMGDADFRVAGDDDDTPDQSRWGEERRLTELDAPADALHKSNPFRGADEALAAQHTQVLQPFSEDLGS